METMLGLTSLILLFAFSSGTDVPALIWSPNRPLSDLPDVFAGHSVSTNDFQNKYLKPLFSEDLSALVVFVQDRLSLDDFTHYADVYNPDSNGRAFQNVKDFMDEHFSVQLPHVKSPMSAVESLRKSYGGKIHELENPYDVSDLPLSSERSNLVVVHLPKIRPGSPEKSITHNDNLIGKVLLDLTKRDVKYTAVYTAKSSSQEADSTLKYKGRHLLETASASSPGYNDSLWLNDTCGVFYALSLEMVGTDESGAVTVANLTKLDKEASKLNCDNNTNLWELKFNTSDNQITDIVLTLNFTIKPMTQKMDWQISTAVLSYNGRFGKGDSDHNSIDLNVETMWAPLGMSYHCAQPDPIRLVNKTISNTTLVFRKLQLQPFDIKKAGKFGLPWDCVGFFTAPIWMALFSIIILLIILAYGLWMILSINVMDRFDDSKGKTITVNAQE